MKSCASSVPTVRVTSLRKARKRKMAKKHRGCADGCGYYWQDEGDDYPRCHFDPNDPFPAPCEEDDWDAEPVEEEDED
jgi:hypothetical protein